MGTEMGWNEVFWFMVVPFGVIFGLCIVLHMDGHGGGGE
jgi:hypothetical protein